jgi:hypothetical protein
LSYSEERAQSRCRLSGEIDPRLVEESLDFFSGRCEPGVSKLLDGLIAAEPFDQFLIIFIGWL